MIWQCCCRKHKSPGCYTASLTCSSLHFKCSAILRISDTTHSPNGVIPHPRCLATSNSRKIFHIKHRQTTCLTVMLWLSKCLRSTSPCDSLASLPTVCWNWLRSRSTPSSFFASDCTESSSFPKSLDVSKGHFSRIHVSASFASA